MDLLSAKELKERIDNNDNRGTAKPYLLLLQRKEEVIANCEFRYDGIKYVENVSGDFTTYESRSAAEKDLRENYYNDPEHIFKKGDIERYYYIETHVTENVFLTDVGYQDHMKENGHNISRLRNGHRTYGTHAFRNREIKSLFALIDTCIEQEERIKELESRIYELEQ